MVMFAPAMKPSDKGKASKQLSTLAAWAVVALGTTLGRRRRAFEMTSGLLRSGPDLGQRDNIADRQEVRVVAELASCHLPTRKTKRMKSPSRSQPRIEASDAL